MYFKGIGRYTDRKRKTMESKDENKNLDRDLFSKIRKVAD